MNWSSAIPADWNVTATGAAAPAAIVNVQFTITPSGSTTRSPDSVTVARPADGTAVSTALPALTPAVFRHPPNVSKFGSKVNANGAIVTMLSPFLVNEIGTVT